MQIFEETDWMECHEILPVTENECKPVWKVKIILMNAIVT